MKFWGRGWLIVGDFALSDSCTLGIRIQALVLEMTALGLFGLRFRAGIKGSRVCRRLQLGLCVEGFGKGSGTLVGKALGLGLGK